MAGPEGQNIGVTGFGWPHPGTIGMNLMPLDWRGGSSGGAGGGGLFSVIDPAQGQSFSRTLNQLMGRLGKIKPPSFESFLKQGMSSPLLQQILGPALANLMPGEEQARQAFMDEFRSAGALGSGAMGAGSARLESALQGQRGNLISQIISGTLPTMVQGLGQQFQESTYPTSLLAQILGQTRPYVMANPQLSGAGGGGGQSVQFFGGQTSPGMNIFGNPGIGGEMPGTWIHQPTNWQGPSYISPDITDLFSGAGGVAGAGFDPFMGLDPSMLGGDEFEQWF